MPNFQSERVPKRQKAHDQVHDLTQPAVVGNDHVDVSSETRIGNKILRSMTCTPRERGERARVGLHDSTQLAGRQFAHQLTWDWADRRPAGRKTIYHGMHLLNRMVIFLCDFKLLRLPAICSSADLRLWAGWLGGKTIYHFSGMHLLNGVVNLNCVTSSN